MGLGRNEKLHLSCAFEGRENECQKQCSRCAISIKKDGDSALVSNHLDEAIRQYKRALFIEPKFAEAWCDLANALSKKSEYNNALSAFDKALAIDSQYGKAMFGKAVALRNLNRLEEAMALVNEILNLYADPEVVLLKRELKNAGIKDKSSIYSLQSAIDAMTDKAYEIIEINNLLDQNGQIHTIQSIDRKEEFAQKIYSFCKRRYGSFENEKVWSETILAAFYGSALIALKYYLNPSDFTNVDPYDYLKNTVDMDALEQNVERLLGVRENTDQSEKIWNIVYSYVSFSISIIEGVEPTSDVNAAVQDAAESAYIMGMLLAMRHHELKEAEGNRLLSAQDNSLTRPIVQLPLFSSKKLSSYKILERIEVSTDSASSDPSVSCQIVAETQDYYVYSYSRKAEYGHFLIRQSKSNLNEIVYFGYEGDSVCYFNGELFYISRGTWDSTDLQSINVVTGITSFFDYKWFSDKAFLKGDVGIGQDTIKSLHVEDGKLVVNVSRRKSSIHQNGEEEDPFDVSMDYKLYVRVENGKYILTYFYTNIDTNLLQVVDSAPRRVWNVATVKDTYYLVDQNKNIAKTPNGYVLQTSYLELAKRLANDLEQYGENAPEMTSLALQMYMRDNVIQCAHQEIRTSIISYFSNTDDWTYHIKAGSSDWADLFGREITRKVVIESWLPRITLMQMNAVFALGRKYKSLNLPFICAAIIEKTQPENRRKAFSTLARYVADNSGHIIQQNDLVVFSLYYEIHFKRNEPSIIRPMLRVDPEPLLTGGTFLKMDHSAAPNHSKINDQIDKGQTPSFCHKCGKQLQGDMFFCPYCGTKRL